MTGLSWFGVTTPVERASYDWRIRAFPPALNSGSSDPAPAIRLLLIDQESLDHFSRQSGVGWPWPRDYHGALLAALTSRGVRLVAFDILFTEPLAGHGEGDAALAEATRASGAVVHAFSDFIDHHRGDVVTAASQRDDVVAERWAVQVADRSAIGWPEADRLVPPLASIEAESRRIGSVRFEPDADGTARSVELLVKYRGRFLPTLPLAVLAALSDGGGDGGDQRNLIVDEARVLHAGRHQLPLDGRGRMALRYLGPAATFESISARALINDYLRDLAGEPAEFEWSSLDGAVVLVGTNFTDLKQVPFATAMPGVEIHANALFGLLHGLAVRPTPGWVAPLASAILALAAGLLLVLTGRPIPATVAALVLGGGYVATAAWAFSMDGHMLPLAEPVVGLLLTIASASLASYELEGRQRRFLRHAFGHYLSPKVIETLVANPDELRLGGTRRELTVFFSDIAGFTTLSEALTPEELVHILNRYLTEMTDIVLARQGTLDKYIGDAVMAFWGAPVALEEAAALACHAALENQARLAVIAPELARPDTGLLAARIGLATGPCVVGNMGSATTFNYTVMGDTVNLAARLEGLNKEYGTRIIASGATRRAAGPGFLWRELDLVRVKGKTEAVDIHELVATIATSDPQQRELASLHDAAVVCYRKGGFVDAVALWDEALKLCPDDGPCRVLRARCLQYLIMPPPDDWRGEHVMHHK